MSDLKFEIRNSKLETDTQSEFSKVQTDSYCLFPSNFEFVSDFDIRI